MELNVPDAEFFNMEQYLGDSEEYSSWSDALDFCEDILDAGSCREYWSDVEYGGAARSHYVNVLWDEGRLNVEGRFSCTGD